MQEVGIRQASEVKDVQPCWLEYARDISSTIPLLLLEPEDFSSTVRGFLVRIVRSWSWLSIVGVADVADPMPFLSGAPKRAGVRLRRRDAAELSLTP
jgi:hypothetical protein